MEKPPESGRLSSRAYQILEVVGDHQEYIFDLRTKQYKGRNHNHCYKGNNQGVLKHTLTARSHCNQIQHLFSLSLKAKLYYCGSFTLYPTFLCQHQPAPEVAGMTFENLVDTIIDSEFEHSFRNAEEVATQER
jgi:hypothetical protein